jgi:hypothetical protein
MFPCQLINQDNVQNPDSANIGQVVCRCCTLVITEYEILRIIVVYACDCNNLAHIVSFSTRFQTCLISLLVSLSKIELKCPCCIECLFGL